MDRDVIHQICQQQVKREERCSQEEVVHGMEIDVTHRGDDEHQKEKEKQRYGRGVADFSCQRSGLQFFRHGHADLKAGDEVRVLPRELPASVSEQLRGGRERVIGEVDIAEVGLHHQLEV